MSFAARGRMTTRSAPRMSVSSKSATKRLIFISDLNTEGIPGAEGTNIRARGLLANLKTGVGKDVRTMLVALPFAALPILETGKETNDEKEFTFPIPGL